MYQVISQCFGKIFILLIIWLIDQPTVEIESNAFHMVNEPSTLKCIVAGYPKPDIFWLYKPCMGDNCVYQKVIGLFI